MANTGYKGWATLEQYYTDDGSATGVTKPNSPSDDDYVPAVQDNTACPPYTGNILWTIYFNNNNSNAAGSMELILANDINTMVLSDLLLSASFQTETYIQPVSGTILTLKLITGSNFTPCTVYYNNVSQGTFYPNSTYEINNIPYNIGDITVDVGNPL